jgi:4-diphosphocytidyl-2C-methyl-D-erythritol kinase
VGKSIWNESVLVVSPAAAVNTRQFYDFYRSRVSTFHRAGEVPLIERVRRASDVRDLVHNDFEQAVCEFAPEVGRCLDIVRRHVPRGSAVTGSGAAIFALVENRARSTMAVLEQELGARGAGVCRTTLM